MGRYDHALNRCPKIEKSENVKTFGFDDDIVGDLLKLKKRYPYFRLNPGERAEIALIVDNPEKIFVGTFVHWYDKYFLCNSIKGHKAFCCNKLKNRIFRAACVIVKYVSKDNYQVMPWCFGKKVVDTLYDINRVFPLDKNDLIVQRTIDVYTIYDIQAKAGSCWQKNCDTENILKAAQVYRENLIDCIGEKLSPQEVFEMLNKK